MLRDVGNGERRGTSSVDRLLALLDLFDEERPVWTVEEAAPLIGVSVSTAYRYFRSLCDAGMLDPVAGAGYRLGPEIIELDRKVRLTDPLMQAAMPAMQDLARHTVDDQVVILCRLFRDQVMCLHRELGTHTPISLSYERGRPRSMFRGATSKVILAHLPHRVLKRAYERHRDEIAGLGSTWDEFRTALKAIRRQGYCVTRGDVDEDLVGIAAPVMNGEGRVVGSLSVVGTAASMEEVSTSTLIALTRAAADETRERLAALEASENPTAPRASG